MARPGVLPRMAALVALVAGPLLLATPAGAQPATPPQGQASPGQTTPTPTPAPTTSSSTGKPAAAGESPVEADVSALPSDPDRIRRALERPALVLPATTTLEVDGTTFRVSVTQKPFDIWKYWGPSQTAVSSKVRTSYFSNWHHDYLRMVTPEAGRRAALYPGGMVSFMPALSALTNAIEDALRKRAERKAKEEVQQALEDFFREHPEARVASPSTPAKPPL